MRFKMFVERNRSFAMKTLLAVLLPVIITTTIGSPIDGFKTHPKLLEANGPLADNQDVSLDSMNPMDENDPSNFDPPSYPFRHLRGRRNATNTTSGNATNTKTTTTDVTTVLERMQMIARLTNAIYLQKALINGTVQPETLISELLHFGSVTPTQIHAINLVDMEKALTTLRKLPSELEYNDDVRKLELFYGNVSSLLKGLEGVKDVSAWPDKDSYKQDIANLKAGTAGNFTFANELQATLDSWKTFQAKVVVAKQDPLVWDNVIYIRELGKDSARLIEAGKSLKTAFPKIFEFTNKKTANESVSYLTQLMTSVEKANNQPLKFSRNGFNHVKASVGKIKNALSAAKKIEATSDMIANMFSSRATSVTFKIPTYTISLPDGYEDIVRMLSHFNNPWFLSIVKDKRLSDSFKSLKFDGVNAIEKQLMENRGFQSETDTMSHLVSLIAKLDQTFASYSIEGADQVDNCRAPNGNDYEDDPVKSLVRKAAEIDVEIVKLQSSLESLRSALNDVDLVKDLQKLVDIGGKVKDNDPASWKTAFADFKKIQNFKEIVTNVTDISVTADKIIIVNLQAVAKDSEPLFADFETFLKKAEVPIGILNCLNSQPSTLPTIKVIQDSKDLRNKKSEHEAAVSKALEVVKKVDGTKKELKGLRTSIKGIKNFKSRETDLLFTLKNSFKIYDTIGLAFNGIESMKLAIDSKSKIGVIKSESGTVTSESKSAKDKKLLSDADTALLSRFPTLEASLNAIYPKLDAWVDDVKKLNVTNLSDYAEVFVKAKGVTGINEDLGAMSQSLEKLIRVSDPTKKNKLKQVKDALDSFVGMGTLFANYSKNFDGTKKSLADLDLFFSSYAKSISVTPPPPMGSPYANGYNGSESEFGKKKDATGWSIAAICGVSAGGVIVVAVFVVSIVLLCCCRKKSEEIDPEYIYVPMFKRSEEPVKPVWITVPQLSQFIRTFMTQLIEHGNKEIKDGERSWDIDANALFNPGATTHAATVQDVEYVFADFLKSWCRTTYDIVDKDLNERKLETINERVTQNKAEYREKVEVANPTRVILPLDSPLAKFETDFLHANNVELDNKFLMVLTQGPQNANPAKGKTSTMEKFWYVVFKEKYEGILMLCRLQEGNVVKCDEYYPQVKSEQKTFGKFTISCTAVISETNIVQRTMSIRHADEELGHTFTHFQYLAWPDKSVPSEARDLVKLWRLARDCRKGIVVHCSAGIGRSGTVALMECLYQAVCASEDGNVAHKYVLSKLREKRARCVQNSDQYTYCYYALTELMFDRLEDVPPLEARFLEWMRQAWLEIRPKTDQELNDVNRQKAEKKKVIDARVEKNAGKPKPEKAAKTEAAPAMKPTSKEKADPKKKK